jgi:PAS domain S-box-containing protein
MDDPDRSKEQLLAELAALRQQVATLEQTQASLRESEERFRKVFEEGPIGVLLVGTDGRIQQCNRRFCEMLRYSEGEILTLGLAGISHPDDWERDYPFVSRLWHGEIPYYHLEKRYVRKDGQVIWAHVAIALMHDAAGRPTNSIGMVEDITERKRAEERLRDSERTLRTLMDASPESILLVDRDETILLANATMARRFGTSVDQIVGRKPQDILPAEIAANRRKHIQEVIRTGKAVRFDDERFDRHIENAFYPILDEQGGVASIAVLGIDQTERQRAEEALRKAHDELEQRVADRTAALAKANEDLVIFRKFAEASGEGFGMSDFDGRIAYANPALSRLFGEKAPSDVVGQQSSAYFPEDYVLRRKTEMIPALLREGYWHAEQTVLPRHGKPISTLESAFLIRDENGEPFRIAVVISDITEWKRAEAALRRQQQTLKHLLRASDHERQLIAYEIHDGLAQQLTGALMQFEVFAHLKDTQAEQAEDAFHAGVVMLRQGHFEARRLIAGVRPPILDESGVVEGIAHLVHEQGRGTRQKIDFRSRVDFDRLVPTLENSIYRIAQEGLTNACQHSQSGKVQVSLLQHGDAVKIEIRDWGVGFDAKAACKNRFGLEGIRQRARLLGGKCSIRSAPGKGTRIAVELPVVLREP